MALIKCNGCGKMVSDKAKKCSGCGKSIEKIINSTFPTNETIEKKIVPEIKESMLQEVKNDTAEDNKVKNGISKSALAIVIIVAVIVWSIALVGIVSSSYNKKLDKVLALAEISNTITEENEATDESKKVEMEGTSQDKSVDETDRTEGEIPKQDSVVVNKEKLAEGIKFVSDNDNIEVIFTKSTYGDYLKLYFVISNKTDETIYVKRNTSHYLNNVSMSNSLALMEEEILPGKSTQLMLGFSKGTIESAIQENIHTIDLQLFITVNGEKNKCFVSGNDLDIQWRD